MFNINKKLKIFSLALAIAAGFLLFGNSAKAATKTWTGTTSTAWATSTNWDAGTPTATDDVVINYTGANQPTLDVTAGSVTIASLSLGGGVSASTLTVSNGSPTKKVIVSGNVTIQNNGYLTHTANAAAETHRLFMDVGGNLDVQVGGQINVDGKGYGKGLGPNIGWIEAGYGGGTPTDAFNGLNKSYGSLKNPINLGSSGNNPWGGPTPIGGGAVVLSILGNATINGSVTSIGLSAGTSGGNGSGGSVNISAATVAGSGNIKSNGGVGNYNGSGGRVAVILTSGNDFGTISIQCYGGNYGSYTSAAGTIYLQKASEGIDGGELIVDNNNVGASPTTLIPTSNFTANVLTLGKVTVKNKGILEIPGNKTLQLSGDVSVGTSGTPTDTSQIICDGDTTAGTGVTINAANLTVNAGAVITADGKGYVSSSGSGYCNGGNSAPSYGGQGGNGVCATYGSLIDPINLGSGSSQGVGSGAIKFVVTGATTVNGIITSSAGNTQATSGTGGTINISTSTITGSGTLKTNGGGPGLNNWDSSGGGRIAVKLTNGNDFGSVAMQAYGGAGGNRAFGAAGTIYTETQSQGSGNGTVIIDNNNISTASVTAIPAAQTLTIANLVLKNRGTLGVLTGTTLAVNNSASITGLSASAATSGISLQGGTFNFTDPNLNIQNWTLTINSGSATAISKNISLLSAGYLTASTTTNITGTVSVASGATLTGNAAVNITENMSVGGTANISFPSAITGNLTVISGGIMTHNANNNTETYKMNLTIGGNLDVQTGGQINVDGKGYFNAYGPGYCDMTGGPAYGGRGGGISCSTYGSITDPINLGSGSSQGYGSGAIILAVSGATTMNGIVTSSAGNTQGFSGTGGTINISTSTITGSGTIKTNGGGPGYNNVNYSGGGRIAVKLTTGNDFGSVAMQSYGGSSAAAGTIYKQTASNGVNGGELIVDNNNIAAGFSTYIPTSNFTANVLTLGKVTVKNKGILEIPGNKTLQLSGDVSVGTSGTPADTSQIICDGDTTAGTGVTINAANLTVNAGAVITADGRGYASGGGPGYGNYVAAYGGQAYWRSPVNSTYGSLTNPVNLGSGGYSTSGGGAIIFSISNSATINGTITANSVSGSGGTVNLSAASVSGSGTLKTNGGSNTSSENSSGGRIAVILSSSNDFGSVTMQSYGGFSGIAGAAGTIYTQTQSQGSGNGTVIIDNNNNSTTALTNIPATQTWTIKNLVVKNYGVLSVPTGTTLAINNSSSISGLSASGSTSGIKLTGGTFNFADPTLNIQNWTLTISSGSTTAISKNISLLSAGYLTANTLTNIAGTVSIASGATLTGNAAVNITGDMSVGGTASLNSPGNITGNLTVTSGGILTHAANSTPEAYKLNLSIGGNLDVQTGGQINVDDKGYGSGWGPGSCGGTIAGSYGGQSSSGCSTYGSITNPINLGSGGYNTPGGGAVILSVAGSSIINGTVTSVCANAFDRKGSGGTVNITTATISGNGTIKVNGVGSNSSSGAGRIAVKLTSGNDFGSVAMQAYGGNAASQSAAGTIYKQTATNGVNGGELIVDNNNIAAGVSTYIPTSNFTDNVLALGKVTVKNKGFLEIPAGNTLSIAGDINVGTSGSNTDTAQIKANGSTSLVAQNINVYGVAGTGGSINANATGYARGTGPGAGTTTPSNYGSGGSYGGKGRDSSDGLSLAPNTYGSEWNPTDMGSGGGTAFRAGDGGGALFLTASGTLNILGTISSNGGDDTGAGGGGGGSGGTVNIKSVNILAGSGKIQANGGRGSSAGGGGGRIAYAYNTKSFTGAITANGGATGGNPGTIRSGTLGGTLTSSAYDSSSAANIIAGLAWKEDATLPTGTSVTFNMKTAPDKASLAAQPWTQVAVSTPSSLTAGCTKVSTTVTCANTVIPASMTDLSNDRFFQYQTILTSADLTGTPTVDDVQVLYVVNAPPEIQTVIPTQTNSGDNVKIDYTIKDPDTETGSFTPNYITPTFQYSLDGGSSWNAIASNFYTFNSASSGGQIIDINSNGTMDNKVLSSGFLTYSINWNAQQQLGPNTDIANAQIKVTLNDNEAANNLANLATANFTLKTGSITNLIAVQSINQNTLGKVIIDYNHNIQTNIQASQTIALEYWNGTVWTNATTTTGDIGTNVASGAKQIVWNAKTDFPQYYSATAKVRLLATYNATSQTVQAADYNLDTKNPVLALVPFTIDHSAATNQLSIASPTENSTYQMMVSQNADFSGASLETFSNQKTIALTDDPARVYLKIQDQYGNYTSATAITPDKPRNILYYDISRPLDNLYQEFIAWDTISPAQSGSGSPIYEVYRKDDTQSDFSLYKTISNPDLNYYLDNNVSTDRTYSYKVRTVDSNNDISQYSGIVTDKPNGQGGSDTTPPTISGVSISNITTTSVKVSWSTDELADSSVGYSTDNTYLPERGLASMTNSHSITLTSLNPGTVYFVRVKSRDATGNLGQNDKDNPGVNNISDFRFETLPGPAISSVTIPSISNNQATITWRTNTNSSSYVIYSPTLTNGQLISPKEFGTPDLVGEPAPYGHTVTVNSYNDLPLLTNTRYYFSVKSVDSSGNTANDNNGGNFYEFLTTEDLNPPAISAVQTPVVSQIDAAITWVTDEPATSKVSFGTKNGGPYADTAEIAVYDRNHFVILNSLTADTKYYYKVTSKDINGNESKSAEYDFTTQKDMQFLHDPLSKITFKPTNPSVLTDQVAVIAFDTDQGANCFIKYGPVSGQYDNATPVIEEANVFTKTHSMQIMGLIFSSKYFYKVECIDNIGTSKSSDEQNFTTKEKNYTASGIGGTAISELLDSTPPTISNVSVSNQTGESVTITWDTNENANSSVRYGLLNSDESLAGDSLINKLVANYVTSHTVTISGLIPATKYLYKASSLDASGNITDSSESSFTTASPSSLSSISVTSSAIGEATITWTTNQTMTSSVEYGLTTTYGEKKENTTLTKDHTISLSGLAENQLYHFRVKGKNAAGTIFASADNTFQPKSPPSISNIEILNINEHEATIKLKSNVPTEATISYTDPNSTDNSGSQGDGILISDHEIVLKNLVSGVTFNIKIRVRDEQGTETEIAGPDFTTTKDENPPTFDRIKTDMALSSTDKVQTIISWNTNEPAMGTIIYKEGINAEAKTLQIDSSFTQNHTAIITTLKPGTAYYFKAESKDVSGNIGTSEDYAILTPKKSQNIIQVIIGNFQDIFSWAKN